MKRKGWLGVIALALLAALTSCAAQTVNPLVKNEATALPGLTMKLHPASASDASSEQFMATLYFRYLNEPMLAAESQVLPVKRDESTELAIVQALIDGPSAGHSDLRRLLPADTQVESVVARDDTLFVTFNEGFLNDDVPDNWQQDENWREEAPLLRKLIAQSLAASLTEYAPYTGVQILVHHQNQVQSSLRLENAYFLNGSEGLSEPVKRDESLLLTPQRTAEIILTAWQQHQADQLYQYIADMEKPTLAAFMETLSASPALKDYTVSGGNVAENGTVATLVVLLHTLHGSDEAETTAYPLQLTRENSIWKISMARLKALLNR